MCYCALGSVLISVITPLLEPQSVLLSMYTRTFFPLSMIRISKIEIPHALTRTAEYNLGVELTYRNPRPIIYREFNAGSNLRKGRHTWQTEYYTPRRRKEPQTFCLRSNQVNKLGNNFLSNNTMLSRFVLIRPESIVLPQAYRTFISTHLGSLTVSGVVNNWRGNWRIIIVDVCQISVLLSARSCVKYHVVGPSHKLSSWKERVSVV